MLLQLRVLRFGLLQNGDVGVCVFPQREKILICGTGFGGVALQSVCAPELQMGEWGQRAIRHEAAMVEERQRNSRGQDRRG